MKILPEDKVTVKQVQAAFHDYLNHSEGPYREMNPQQKRHNWGIFWLMLVERIKKDGKL